MVSKQNYRYINTKLMHFPIDRLVGRKALVRSLDTRRVLETGLALCQNGYLNIAEKERF